jgi:hypothetical protein
MAGLGSIDRDVPVNNNAAGGGEGITILPDAVYELEFTELDVAPSSTGKGQNMTGKVKVAAGEYKDVWFFGGINNVQHESSQSQAIAQGTLKALWLAQGQPEDDFPPTDTDQLTFRSFHAYVGSESYHSKKHGKQMTKNVITKYLYEGMPEEDAAPPPASKREPTPAPAAKEEAAAPATKKRPWEK